jgi:aminopeptidase N
VFWWSKLPIYGSHGYGFCVPLIAQKYKMKHFLAAILFVVSGAVIAQNSPGIDFTEVRAKVYPDFDSKSVWGLGRYTVAIAAIADTVRIDAIDMTFSEVRVNGKEVPFKVTKKQILLYQGFTKGMNEISFSYHAKPRQTLYFTGQGPQKQIWTQGQGKYTSHWLPSFDDVNEKAVFNITVGFDKGFEVISNGVLASKTDVGRIDEWSYTMQHPMSSYLVMIAIGKFVQVSEKSKSGVPLTNYILPEDREKYPYTYMHSTRIFDELEKEIGVPYPWQVYKQVPVRDFLYAGMENTTATVFAQDFVVDKIGFNDRSYINVNAHELAHQWFGDMITATSGKHHWLQEGFATYYALLAEKAIFGEDHFNWKLYEMASALGRAAMQDTIPILNPKASSLTFYQKGAWALHVLREQIGESAFKKAVRAYLQEFKFSNVQTGDFLAHIERASGKKTRVFAKEWLESGGFKTEEAVAILKKNSFMKRYFELLAMSEKPLEEKAHLFERILSGTAYHPLKEEVVYQLEKEPFLAKHELLQKALQTGHPEVRQAVAKTLGQVPGSFFESYQTLLADDSYITKEIALNVLWSQFQEKRHELLAATEGQKGLNDYNLRIQWLTLALLTSDFRPEKKVVYYDELLAYGGPAHESSARMNAITNLLHLAPDDKNALTLLPNALVHHKWQFTAYAREKVRASLKRDGVRDFYEKKLEALPVNEQAALKKLLDEK